MGLRDRLKGTAKALLGLGGAPGPRPVVSASPAASPSPVVPPAVSARAETGWVQVARSEQVTDKKAGTYPVPGVPIVAVFRQGGRLWCVDNACAHEDGPVGEGDFSGTCVRCPYHDWEYDFTTGACRTDPSRSLATYGVREQDGFIWVGPRLTEGTKARGGDHNDGMETITR